MSDEKNEVNNHAAKSGNLSAIMTVVALAVMAGAMGYEYMQLTEMNFTLAQTVADMRQQASADQRTLQSMQQALSTLQKSALIAAEREDAAKWNVAEAKYITKQALSQLQLAHDIPAAILLLQHASEIMHGTTDPSVDPIRQALADNIKNLQAQTPVSTEEVYTKLSDMNKELDSLPLPPTPLQYTEEANARQKDYSEAPWWKLQWHKTMDSLRKVVIVRYMGANDMPLVMPEEKMFLYQNLHAEAQAAMLGLLNHNASIYQTSLANMSAWIQKYFIQNAPQTVKVLEQLHALQEVNLQAPSVDMSATLQLFDQYLATNKQTAAATPSISLPEDQVTTPTPAQPVVVTP